MDAVKIRRLMANFNASNRGEEIIDSVIDELIEAARAGTANASSGDSTACSG
jgi:hypothetical protein